MSFSSKYLDTTFPRFTLLMVLLILCGCGTATVSTDTRADSQQADTDVGPEMYTRVLVGGELVGFVGQREATLVRGGSSVTTQLFNIYDSSFQIVGSYDAAGATFRFTRNGPEKLGHFSRDRSFKIVTGIEGQLEFREGLQ